MTGTYVSAPGPIKRFYEDVAIAPHADGFAVALDGREAKTPAGGALVASTQKLAEAIAEEWRRAGETIAVEKTPLTRFLFTVIDRSENAHARWADDVVNYLGSDLLCYRAAAPQALRARQATVWDPYLDWARCVMGLSLETTMRLTAIDQPNKTLTRAQAALEAAAPAAVFGVKAASELTGSAVLAFALWKRAFPAEEIFAASRVDEKFQAERWGVDLDAQARVDRIRTEFMNAARFLTLLDD
ncbi:MAG: ATP12 family protein [Parvularculaceae bacterium]